MIKYLGSKRTLVPILGEMASVIQARTAVDMFTGTTRVAQEFKRRGVYVTAVDIATYSAVLADCYIGTDAVDVDAGELDAALARLNALEGVRGYFTQTFCENARFFQPKNGMRVDAIREAIETEYRDTPLYSILMTSLMLAADRVDSTTGVQMAYLKSWAERSYKDLSLTIPDLIPGSGAVILGDAMRVVDTLGQSDLVYLDPPYNQHRYFTNYHIWETLVRWDDPEPYGVAQKRIDSRDDSTKSIFNKKREMPPAFFDLIQRAKANTLIISYNDESWITADEMMKNIRNAGYRDVRLLAFDRKRYVGAQIGIYNPSGLRVGEVKRLRNVEYVFVAGETDAVNECARVATPHVAESRSASSLF